MKLHLGCGDRHIDGFINIDARRSEATDIVGDITRLRERSFENGSVDLIYACHILEHFDKHEYPKILEDWYALLKPGGILRLSVPDFDMVLDHYTEHRDITKLYGLVCGGQKNALDYHYMIWDEKTLIEACKKAGFKGKCRYWDWRETEHSHIDDYSQAYLPHMDKENGKLMSLNMEFYK